MLPLFQRFCSECAGLDTPEPSAGALVRRYYWSPMADCTVQDCPRTPIAKGLCRAHYAKAWAAANPDSLIKAGRRWYAKNAAAKCAKRRAWRLANPEKARAKRRAAYAACPEKEREACKAYRLADPEKDKRRQRIWRENNPPVGSEVLPQMAGTKQGSCACKTPRELRGGLDARQGDSVASAG